MAQTVKRLPTMWETHVQSLGWEALLEKEMATYSSILAWKIPWTEELGRLAVQGVAKSWTRLSDFTFTVTVAHGRIEDVCRLKRLLRERLKFNRGDRCWHRFGRGQQEGGSRGQGKAQSWGEERFLSEAGVITGPAWIHRCGGREGGNS